jgi:hypothetical protein
VAKNHRSQGDLESSFLIDSDSLSKISGDIWINSFENRELICDQLRAQGRQRGGETERERGAAGIENLEWEDSNERREWSIGRDDNRIWINSIGQRWGVSDDIHLRPSCLHLFCSSSHEPSVVIVEDDGDDRGRSILPFLPFDQSKGAVFQGATTEALGMDVGNLFDLQSAFTSDGLRIAFAENKEMLLVQELLCV